MSLKMKGKLMYQIYIDTTDRYKNIIELRKGNKIIDLISGEVDVVSSIRDLLKKNNIELSEISDFSMNKGPGSFTGLKIGAAIVNVLNWVVAHKKSSDIILPTYQQSKFDNL